MRTCLFALWLFFVMFAGAHTVVGEGAWCWFADPRALHYQDTTAGIDMSYVGYIDTHGSIKAMQYDHRQGRQIEVLVRSAFQPDDHDSPTLLALPDGRIMVFYSRHTDERCFYCRISRLPGDITTLGPEHTIATDHNTTYPSPFILADDPEHIYLCWRGINWHPTIGRLPLPPAESDSEGAEESLNFDDGPYQIVQSTGARPYAKYASDGKSRIWMAYTTGHPDNECPNHLYCSYIDIADMTLRDIRHTKLSDLRQKPLHVDKPADFVANNQPMVVDASPCRNWVWQLALDPDSLPVIAMTRISDDKHSHNYYIARPADGVWRLHHLVYGGGHFHQSPDIEHCYSGGMAIDPDDTSSVYCSVPVAGCNGTVYEIINYRLDPNGEIAAATAVTSNSAMNNVRPYIIPSSSASPLRLLWMHGLYYDWIVSAQRPQGYPTEIYADFPGYEGAQPTGAIDVTCVYHGEDIELDIEGRPMRYTVDATTLKPAIHYDGRCYKGSNALANADVWRQCPRATDGHWYPPTPLLEPSVRFVYIDGTLTTYINGLLDQNITLR